MEKHTMVALGVAMLIGGGSFAAATHYGGPIFIDTPGYSPQFAPIGGLFSTEAAHQKQLKKDIGKEMMWGGGIAAAGAFFAIIGASMKEGKKK